MQLPEDVLVCIFEKCSALTQVALGSANMQLWRYYKSNRPRDMLHDAAGIHAPWGNMRGDGLTFTKIQRGRFVASCRSVKGKDCLLTKRLEAIDEYCTKTWGANYRSFLCGMDHKGALVFKGRINHGDLRREFCWFAGTFKNKESPFGLQETVLNQEDGGCDGYDLIWLDIAPTVKWGKHEVDILLKSCRSIWMERLTPALGSHAPANCNERPI